MLGRIGSDAEAFDSGDAEDEAAMTPTKDKDYWLVPLKDGIRREQARCMQVFDDRIIFVAVGATEGPFFTISMHGGPSIQVGARVFEVRPGGLWREQAKCYYTIEEA